MNAYSGGPSMRDRITGGVQDMRNSARDLMYNYPAIPRAYNTGRAVVDLHRGGPLKRQAKRVFTNAVNSFKRPPAAANAQPPKPAVKMPTQTPVRSTTPSPGDTPGGSGLRFQDQPPKPVVKMPTQTPVRSTTPSPGDTPGGSGLRLPTTPGVKSSSEKLQAAFLMLQL